MFTGIIEELGRVRSVASLGENARIVIEAHAVTEGTNHGDSIAVNGVCLTALERAVTPATRLGGHIVQGHVDATGKFLEAIDHGGSWTVRIAYPREISPYLVFKGSVTVEGISLTIAALNDDHFDIAVIPKTWEVTNFSQLRPGDEVNLEADVIAKYVERILDFRRNLE